MSFTYVFYQHIMFRHSCGVCHFTNTKRPSDITIADFWGWQKTDPEFNKDDKGVSLLLINTEKGRRLFEAVKGNLNYFPAELENVMQPNLYKPSDIHPQRDAFEQDYIRHGMVHAFKKFGMMGWRYNVKIYKQKIRSKLSCIRHKIIRK